MPTVNLTERFITSLSKKLPPKGRVHYYNDAKVKGFQLKVHPTGKMTYYVATRDIHQRKFTRKIATTETKELSEARNMAQQMIGKVQSPDFGKNKANLTKSITLKQAFEEHINRRHNKESTNALYRRHLNRYFLNWKNLPLHEITDEMVDDWYHSNECKKTKGGASTAFRTLKAVLNTARRKGYILDNPTTVITAGEQYKLRPRTGHLNFDEQLSLFVRAIAALRRDPKHSRSVRMLDLHMFWLLTGLRMVMGSKIRWEWISEKRMTISIPELLDKNDEPMVIPIAGTLHSLLRARGLGKEKKGYVFGTKTSGKPPNDPRKTTENIVAKMNEIAGTTVIEKLLRHDLRRTFATALSGSGSSFHGLKQMMNHKGSDITAMYVIPDPEIVRKDLQRMEGFLARKIPLRIPDSEDYSLWVFSAANIIRKLIWEPNLELDHLRFEFFYDPETGNKQEDAPQQAIAMAKNAMPAVMVETLSNRIEFL